MLETILISGFLIGFPLLCIGSAFALISDFNFGPRGQRFLRDTNIPDVPAQTAYVPRENSWYS